jgi:hypothetical protein
VRFVRRPFSVVTSGSSATASFDGAGVAEKPPVTERTHLDECPNPTVCGQMPILCGCGMRWGQVPQKPTPDQ